MLIQLRGVRDSDEGGFTLIELLVVIIIIGTLAGIAIPVFLSQRTKGWDAQAKSDARNLASFEEAYIIDNGTYQVAANMAAVLANFPDYRASVNVTAVAITNYALGGTVGLSTRAPGGYCIVATSASGNTFAYDSSRGGPQGVNSTCP